MVPQKTGRTIARQGENSLAAAADRATAAALEAADKRLAEVRPR